MSSTVNVRQINGVVRTSEPVWANLERLAEASTSWFTYDVHSGLYSWVINNSGNVVTGGALSEADIIGPLQISGSGLTNLYNAVEIEYPNKEIRDQPHYVRIDLPAGIRNAYEPDNTLQITSEFINNQPQAMYMADVTLRQSRLDRTVTFNTDYTKINLRAGDIISITSDTYGWAAKEFRIMRVREVEGDDGSLRLEFSCSEYDDGIYEGDISEFLVGGQPGIISMSSIGKPGTPTAEIVNTNGVPTIQVVSTVPTGIIDRMQVWAGNVAATGNVANTQFNLVSTIASTDANAFTTGANVAFSVNNLADGTYAFKSRGVNGAGTGPFSDASANLVWSTANILANTTSESSTSGPIFQAQLNQGYQYSVSAGKIIGNVTQSSSTTDTKLLAYSTFTVPASVGNTLGYKVDAVFEQNASGALGGRGPIWSETTDAIACQVELFNGPAGNLGAIIFTEGSGGIGAFGWTDFITVGFANLVAGNTYTLGFGVVNYTESNPAADANITVGWNVYTNNNADF